MIWLHPRGARNRFERELFGHNITITHSGLPANTIVSQGALRVGFDSLTLRSFSLETHRQ
jgi:hypothetical protein